MKVLICGSREHPHGMWCQVSDRIKELPNDTEVIHGGAGGVDLTAGYLAERRGLKVTEFPADWKRYGRSAGIRRNIQMLDEKPDLVIAFQYNMSRGTGHTIREAQDRDIPVEVHNG